VILQTKVLQFAVVLSSLLAGVPVYAQGTAGEQAQTLAQVQNPAQVKNRLQLVVFPFVSDEPRLGVAVADRLFHAFSDPGVAPELALGLVPPLLLREGSFVSPLNLLGDEQTGSRYAAALLRETLAAETTVTGRVRLAADPVGGLELELFVARPGGARSFLFRAPEAFPDRLVRQAQAALAAFADLTPRPEARFSLDLSSPYGTFIDGLVNLGSGFPEEAYPLLRRAAAALSAEPRWQRRAAGLEALLVARSDVASDAARARYPLLAAVVALNTQPFEEAAVSQAFAVSELPLARLWTALLAAQTGEAVFAATPDYPFSDAERLLYRASRSGARGARDAALETDLQALLARQPESLSVPVGGLFVAQTLRDAALEQRLAERLIDLAPAFAYPYERLSHLAFDRDDPTAAAVALRTATRLEPGSDLYWTNLGWAYYLLGVLGESEAATERALELNQNELVALYNLGLVQVVTGRLGVSLDTYAEAVLRDLEGDETLDPAAIADLQDALARYPAVSGVHYALATLLEADGKFGAAAGQFERYAARGEGALATQAAGQARVLRAPPPPLEIGPGARVGVGPDVLEVTAYAPGDLLYTRLEVATPGDALPLPLRVALRLENGAGLVVAEAAQTERTPLPPNTVALEVDAALTLPTELPPGRYQLVATASARGRSQSTTLPLQVTAGAPPLVRQLLGRGITLRSLGTGLALYTLDDAGAATGGEVPQDDAFVETLQDELAASADAAAETLPEPTRGRFSGLDGSALFRSSSAQDVRDFLGFLLQDGAGTDAPLVELYARWALGGAPTP